MFERRARGAKDPDLEGYGENFAHAPGFGTHYVVLAYRLELSRLPSEVPDDQHRELRWWSVDDLLASQEVHPNTKAYF